MGNISLFIILLASTGVREVQTTSAKRKVDVRIFDHGYTASHEEVQRKLHQAALTERGFKKTTAFTESMDVESGRPFERKMLRFQKRVPCQEITKVEEELRNNMPGVWGNDVREKVREEAKKTRGKDVKCDAGIEIHLPLRGCPQQNKQAKRAIGGGCKITCLFCFLLTLQ